MLVLISSNLPERVADGPRAWVPVLPQETQMKVLGPDPALLSVNIWEVNQGMEEQDLSLPTPNSAFQIKQMWKNKWYFWVCDM